MVCTLINIHNFSSSKTGKSYSVIQVSRALSQREIDNGYIGTSILEEHFLPDTLVGFLNARDIGTEINLVHEVYGGKANLVNIERKEK